MTGTAALPRSSLHLALLEANPQPLAFVLYRDAHLAPAIEARHPGKGVYLGREGRLPRHPLGALRQILANRRYYAEVEARLAPLGIERLILFLEGEPLERSIVDWFEGEIELWEEGLSHYIDLTGPAWYAARGLAQIASGFYPHGALARRADRAALTVRDRFETGTLVLPPPPRRSAEEAILFVGSPLAEDGIIPRARMRKGLARIAAVSPLPLRYLPHPREDRAALEEMLSAIDGADLAPLPHGIAPHVGAHGYRGFVAPASTALLDLGAFECSLFVPAIFGAARMHKALSRWRKNPVALASNIHEVSAFLRRCGMTD